VLHYFACRGRGQAFIYLLEDAGQPYTLEEVALGPDNSWSSIKADKDASGTYTTPPPCRGKK
jgi:hypothetical protein